MNENHQKSVKCASERVAAMLVGKVRLCTLSLLIVVPVLVGYARPLQSGGNISGVVLDYETGMAIPEVSISLTIQPAAQIGNTRVPQPAATVRTVTDGAGSFRASDLLPGTYTVKLEKTGFDASIYHPGPVNLKLETGQQLGGIKFQLMKLNAVSGTVYDALGNPRVGINVEAIRPYYDQGRMLLSAAIPIPLGGPLVRNPYAVSTARVQTNERGQFHLYGLFPGKYYLAVVRDQESPQYFPGVADPMDATPVTVGSGIDEHLDFHMAQFAKYSVRLKLALPKDVKKALDTFHVYRRSSNGMETLEYLGNIGNGLRLVSDQDQIYSLDSLPRGSFELSYGLSGVSLDWLAQGHLDFDITDHDVVDAGVLEVLMPAALSGHVHVPPGVNLTTNNIRITLLRTGDNYWNQIRFFPRVAADGTFKFEENVRRQPYWVNVTGLPDGYSVVAAEYEGMDVLEKQFIPEDSGDGSLNLTIGAAGSVGGIVEDSAGHGVPDSLVVVVPPIGGDKRNPLLYRTATTDEKGAFEIRNIQPRNGYSIFALNTVDSGEYQNASFIDRLSGRESKISVSAGTVQNVTMHVIADEVR